WRWWKWWWWWRERRRRGWERRRGRWRREERKSTAERRPGQWAASASGARRVAGTSAAPGRRPAATAKPGAVARAAAPARPRPVAAAEPGPVARAAATAGPGSVTRPTPTPGPGSGPRTAAAAESISRTGATPGAAGPGGGAEFRRWRIAARASAGGIGGCDSGPGRAGADERRRCPRVVGFRQVGGTAFASGAFGATGPAPAGQAVQELVMGSKPVYALE